MKEKYFFGIDGGGTRSRLALVNMAGEVIVRAEGGSTNIYSVTKEEVFANIGTLIESALEKAGLAKGDITAGCIGSAGLGREAEQTLFRIFFDRIIDKSFPVKICTDGEILLCGGLENPEGYCLIAGTGSAALGRSAEGRLVRSGGHGYMLGDEGSASWIGRSAIARTLRSIEGRDLPTGLLEAVLLEAGLEKSESLIQFVHHDADKARIASFAPLVTKAARKGDILALDILRKGAAELALLVKSAVSQSPWIKHMELVLAGGVIEHDEIITGELKKTINSEMPGLKVLQPKGTALEGACMLARSDWR